MNINPYESANQEELTKEAMAECYSMANSYLKEEAHYTDAPEDVVINCEMIWLQVNQ